MPRLQPLRRTGEPVSTDAFSFTRSERENHPLDGVEYPAQLFDQQDSGQRTVDDETTGGVRQEARRIDKSALLLLIEMFNPGSEALEDYCCCYCDGIGPNAVRGQGTCSNCQFSTVKAPDRLS